MDPEPLFSSINLLSSQSGNGIIFALVPAIILLIICSGFFSMSEAAYLSSNRIRLKSIESNGSKRATKVLKQLENYDKIINTITICNNIANITAASLSTILFARLIVGNESLSAVVSTVVLTILIIIFGETIPKSIGKEHSENIAIFAQPTISALVTALTPLVWFFGLWRKIYRSKKSGAAITGDELITIVEEAENDGEIDSHESRLIKSAIEFEDVDLYDVMIPRVDVVFIRDTDTADYIQEVFHETGFSRLPVFHESVDSIIGILHEKDFYAAVKENKEILSTLKANTCLSKNMKISAALRVLQKSKTHMAIVVDEFGGTSGIVTMEDILEELVGEIYDEHDEEEVLFSREDDNTYIVSGAENLEDLFESLGVNVKEEFESVTVGGWVTEQLERIPAIGESFRFQNLEITILKANGRKVIEVKVFIDTAKNDEELLDKEG